MSAFGGLQITNKGRALQAKAQIGTTIHYNRIAIGDGSLSGQVIAELNELVHEKKSLTISKLKTLTGGLAAVGAPLSNQDISTGFYFREIGVFAQDPDIGEILYCYGNAGQTADYIPAGGEEDILEREIDVITIVGNTANVSASINQSLVYATLQDLAGKAPIDSPVFMNKPKVPTAPAGTNTDQAASTAFVRQEIQAIPPVDLSALAPKNNPVFTGTGITLPADPTAPMQAVTLQLLLAKFEQATRYAP
ncbi:phage tail protein [Paenibacillus anseongense]|uniref:phage tail-collar fiber domain-containing protein n=1 Tax=Paenibacillus anseongense TaxID=2682845 RepID=UPI002DB96333|nr:phage tail protein [Paenibacillus anseongense]MEC0269048.1 phage tail protein [Paenibacillus anseongense]